MEPRLNSNRKAQVFFTSWSSLPVTHPKTSRHRGDTAHEIEDDILRPSAAPLMGHFEYTPYWRRLCLAD